MLHSKTKKEPDLCPDCPLTREWKDEALRRIRRRELIKTNDKPSNLKICMERRRILAELGFTCPYYDYSFSAKPKTNNIG